MNGKLNNVHMVEVNEGDAIIVSVNGQPSVLLVHTQTSDSYSQTRKNYHFTAAGVAIKTTEGIYSYDELGNVGTTGTIRAAWDNATIAAVNGINDLVKAWSWIK